MASFSIFPPELVVNVFAFVRKSQDSLIGSTDTLQVRSKRDLNNLSLVNKTCQKLVAPIQWNKISTCLVHKPEAIFEALIDPPSNIRANVKHLVLEDTRDRSLDSYQQNRFLSLFAQWPEGQLISFSSSASLNVATRCMMFKTQSRLDAVSIHFWKDCRSSAIIPISTLNSVETLDVFLNSHAMTAGGTSWQYGHVLRSTPRLSTLAIASEIPIIALSPCNSSAGLADLQFIDSPSSERGGGQSRLHKLVLSKLIMGYNYSRISYYIDFTCLRELDNDCCAGPQRLLQNLTRTFMERFCSLVHLRVCLLEVCQNIIESPGIRQDIEALLMSFKGLKKLCLEMAHHALVSKESIANHQLTLQALAVGRWTGKNSTYSVRTLWAILTSCPNLRELGLCIDKESEPLGLEDTCFVHPVLTCCASTIAIAVFSKLHTLRIMDMPFFHHPEVPSPADIDRDSTQMQILTSLVFKKLVAEGSNIKVIAWCPPSGRHVTTWDKRADLNGHIWPEHVYYKGRLTHWCQVNEVVAVPIANFREEMAESSILDC